MSTKQLLHDIQQQVQLGKYYEAQQMYKGMSDKFLHKKKFDKSVHILVTGTRVMMEKKQATLALELANSMIEVFEKCENCALLEPKWQISKNVSMNALELIEAIANLFPMVCAERALFLKEAISWSAKCLKTQETGGMTQGEPSLHTMLANTFRAGKVYSEAHKQYSLSESPNEHAEFLFEWALEGHPHERDLFITRAVLQYVSD